MMTIGQLTGPGGAAGWCRVTRVRKARKEGTDNSTRWRKVCRGFIENLYTALEIKLKAIICKQYCASKLSFLRSCLVEIKRLGKILSLLILINWQACFFQPEAIEKKSQDTFQSTWFFSSCWVEKADCNSVKYNVRSGQSCQFCQFFNF